MNRFLKDIKKNKILLLFFALILLLGLYLRITGVLSNSFAYTYDVGRDMLQVQQIVENHKIPLIGQTTGLGGLFYGPWWYYILTPAFTLSGGNPQGVALFMVLVGLLVIILSYVVGEKIKGQRFGLVFASLVAFSPVMVGLSNQIWNPNIAPFFILLSLLSLFYIQKKVHLTSWYLILGLLLGLLLDTEIVFGVLYIVSVIISYFWIVKRLPSVKNAIFLILGFLIILSPRLLFEVRHNFIMMRTLFAPGGVKEAIFSYSNIFTEVPNRALTLFHQYSDTLANGNIIIALIFLFLTVCAVFLARENKTKLFFKYFVTCFIIVLVFLVGTTFFARAIWGHYLVGLPVFYLLSFACMLEQFWKGKTKIISILAFLIAVFFMINPIAQLQSITGKGWEGDAAVYRNQVAVVDYVYKSANGKQFNYTAYTPVVHDYTYQYLFSWYGKKQYGYIPSGGVEKKLYLIIEPDPGYEGRITDWLKVREGDGKAIEEKVIKGGIKVQTRTR